MSQKWNLQDIKPATQPRKKLTTGDSPAKTRPTQKKTAGTTTQTPKKTTRAERTGANARTAKRSGSTSFSGGEHRKKNLLIAGGISVVVLLFGVYFGGAIGEARLVVYPEFYDATIQADITAATDPSSGGLQYEIMTIEETRETQVQASGQIEVQEQASGQIEIRKTTPGSQRLIKNTRFRSPEGLVFRIPESVTVPGATSNSAGEVVAGVVTTDVFADDVGEAYNLAANTTFDVPGFEESNLTELYDAITATNPRAFTGGFVGPQFQIDDAELNAARTALQSELQSELLTRITSSRPVGTIAFESAATIAYEQLPAVESSTDEVTIREKATLQIPLFKNTDVGTYLAQATIATYAGGTVRIQNPESLTFAYDQAATQENFNMAESITFTLTGSPRLLWEYDAEKLATDLAGLPHAAVKNAITTHVGIEAAKADISPFWRTSFPEDPSDILIVEELREE